MTDTKYRVLKIIAIVLTPIAMIGVQFILYSTRFVLSHCSTKEGSQLRIFGDQFQSQGQSA